MNSNLNGKLKNNTKYKIKPFTKSLLNELETKYEIKLKSRVRKRDGVHYIYSSGNIEFTLITDK